MSSKANHQQGNKLSAAERREKVASLYVSGASYRSIADHLTKLGFKTSKSTVENDVKAVFAALDKKSLETISEFRGVQFRRYNSLILANWTEAAKGNIKAGELIRKLMNDMNDLFGAKSAIKIEHGGSVETVQVAMTIEEWKKQQSERRVQAAATQELFDENE